MNKLALLLCCLLLSACNGSGTNYDYDATVASGTVLVNDADGDGETDDTSNTDTTITNPNTIVTDSAKVLAFNDLGMHCMDKEYSIFSILPPFNVVNAQVVRPGQNNMVELLNSSQVELRYSPIADKQGSINSSSVRKTDFWQHANALFGVNLPNGQGLKGLYMPADNPTAPGEQAFSYDTQADWFSAAGIPITPTDDAGQNNPYPLLRISAYDKQSNKLLGSTDVVVPVAKETDCQNCHVSGKIGAQRSDVAWATDSDLEVQAKKNILLLHDKQNKTDLIHSTPVLCAQCHYSPALDLEKKGAQGVQQQLPTLSQVMHKYHGELKNANGQLVFPNDAPIEQSCYQCHPGKDTQCQRDVMRNAGIQCYECHGNLAAVAGTHPLQIGGSLDGGADGKSRRSWMDLPRCQSCHTGDAVNFLKDSNMVLNSDGFRLRQAYRTGDLAASPILASNKRFAENNNTLFRNSKGHGNVACEACHGSTHATWETTDPNGNDNVAAQQLQGHRGTILECGTCHASGTLPLTLSGPHGMHNVNDARWINGSHSTYYRRSSGECKACHGNQLQGTALSKVAIYRDWTVEGRSVKLQAGDTVGCGLCHKNPL
ncbi:MAG: hypothetical protein R3E08_07370 [Thiotrichaceae bacterium]